MSPSPSGPTCASASSSASSAGESSTSSRSPSDSSFGSASSPSWSTRSWPSSTSSADGVPRRGAERAGREVDAELLGRAEQLVVLLAHLDLAALLREDVDVEAERLHLLQQHLEGLGDRRLGDVLALDDRLVGLHAPDGVVGLDREHLLERVRGAVRLERPHLHLAEALAAELRLAAQRLLRDERVRAGRARVDLVVHEVEQLEDVHVADGDLLLERLAGAAVEQPELAGGLAALRPRLVDEERDRRVRVLLRPLDQRLVDVLRRGAVEHRRRDRARLLRSRPR